MPIITCPACQGTVQMPDEMQGLAVVCPLCRQTFRAPKEEREQTPPEPSNVTEARPPPREQNWGTRRRRSILNLEEQGVPDHAVDISLPPRSSAAAAVVRGPSAWLQALGLLQIGSVPIVFCTGALEDRVDRTEIVILVFLIVGAIGGLQLFAGWCLRNFRNLGVVIAGALVSVFSCIGVFVCIWVFVTIARPQVRAAFGRGSA